MYLCAVLALGCGACWAFRGADAHCFANIDRIPIIIHVAPWCVLIPRGSGGGWRSESGAWPVVAVMAGVRTQMCIAHELYWSSEMCVNYDVCQMFPI